MLFIYLFIYFLYLGVEKLLDAKIDVDEKISLATGILVETFVKVPFARPAAEAVASRISKIMLPKKQK